MATPYGRTSLKRMSDFGASIGWIPASRSIQPSFPFFFFFVCSSGACTGFGSPRYCSTQRMRVMSGGSGQTRLLVSISGSAGAMATSGSGFFFFLPADALGATDKTSAPIASHNHVFRSRKNWLPTKFRIFTLLRYFDRDSYDKTANLVLD